MTRVARVLVVDDEPMFRDLIRAVLSIQRHHVELASDGFEALQLLAQSSFDCIVVDYHLPEMDGYAFARLVKDLTRDRPEKPTLIAVTADQGGLALRRGSDAMFHAILQKPVLPRTLLACIEAALPVSERDELARAADALVANPAEAAAAAASRAFWKAAGLPDRPRIVTWPAPTPDQHRALSLCFDVVDLEQAQVLVILGAANLPGLTDALGYDVLGLPTISLDKLDCDLVDLEFSLLDRSCWHRLAALIHATKRGSDEKRIVVERSVESPDVLAGPIGAGDDMPPVGSGWPFIDTADLSFTVSLPAVGDHPRPEAGPAL